MANNASKRPSAGVFQKVVAELGGNLTKVAQYFGVARSTVYSWIEADPSFATALKDERLKVFDEVLGTARIVALGIPKYEWATGPDGELEYDESGRPLRRMVGWSVPPDSNMLRFFMSIYGHYDRIGFTDDGCGDVPEVNEGVSISAFVEMRNEGKKADRQKKGGHKRRT